MSYDDDLSAIPSVCKECFAKMKDIVGVVVFKCTECKYEFCFHLETAKGSRVCMDCSKAAEHGPVDYM